MDATGEEEFRRFVRARWNALVRTAYLLTGDQGRAEDLVQQTLVKVHRRWEHISRDDGTGGPYAHTRAALANESASWWRRRRVAETLGEVWVHADRATMEVATGVPIDAATAAVRPFVLHGGGAETGTMSYEVFASNAAKVRLVSSSPSLYPSTAKLPTPKGTALVTTPTWSSEQRSPYDIEVYDRTGTKVGQWPIDLPSEDTWTKGTAGTRP